MGSVAIPRGVVVNKKKVLSMMRDNNLIVPKTIKKAKRTPKGANPKRVILTSIGV